MTHEADCHYGDHEYLANGRCKWCRAFNAYVLLEGKRRNYCQQCRQQGHPTSDHLDADGAPR